MYNSVPTTCFGHFLTGHLQVGYNVGGTIYLYRPPFHSTRNDHTATTADHFDTQAIPGYKRRKSQPLRTTQPTDNGHIMPTILKHVFGSHHRSTHTPYLL